MWPSNSVLSNPTPNTPCQDIFQAVCDEIGEHYQKIGYKYAKGRPKLTYRDKFLKVEIAFWSSRSNIPGDYVNLTIIPSFYSLEVVKKGLSKIESKIAKGLILSHEAFCNTKAEDTSQSKLIQIFGDEQDRPVHKKNGPVLTWNNSCNVYGIDETGFGKILEFIDLRILPWIEKIQTQEGTEELLQGAPREVINGLKGKSTNSDFIPYCKLMFPDLDLKEWF